MVREIVKSAKQTYTLNIPDDMIGKTVEVIAFEINSDESVLTQPANSSQEILNRYSQYPAVSHKNYRFDRSEANDYE